MNHTSLRPLWSSRPARRPVSSNAAGRLPEPRRRRLLRGRQAYRGYQRFPNRLVAAGSRLSTTAAPHQEVALTSSFQTTPMRNNGTASHALATRPKSGPSPLERFIMMARLIIIGDANLSASRTR